MSGIVADLIRTGAVLHWKCQQCERMGPVNVQAIRNAKGDDYELTDKTAPCRTPGCGYWVTFYARDGMRMRALVTPAFQMQLSDRRTRWLAERRARLVMSTKAGL